MLDRQASDIKTNYFKIGHVKNIQYTIYTTANNNEQELLELELSLRHQHPNILLTYYNKCLFYFLVDDAIHDTPSLVESNPIVKTKFQSTVIAEKLANPPKTVDNEEYLAFANISFLRALKKMILYNLSIQQVVKVFGNHCVVSEDNETYRIVCIDPILLATGDMLMSCVERKTPHFYNSSLLFPNETIKSQAFVVYILPSGIRCHLFDPTNLKSNFVSKPQFENEQLLRLLQLNTGIESLQGATWVKLIPNLKHLNNQTSSISKFVHTVENKKYILWPWNLCLLQLGLREKIRDYRDSTPNYSNPMNLLSEFLDFTISHKAELERAEQILYNQHLQQMQQLSQLETQPTNVRQDNERQSPSLKQEQRSPSTGSTNTVNEAPRNLGPLDIGLNTPLGGDIFNLQVNDNFFPKQENSVPEERNADAEDDNDMEIDELFGGHEDASEDAFLEEGNQSGGNIENIKDEADDLFKSGTNLESPFSDGATQRLEPPRPESNSESKSKKVLPYIDILSTGMTVGKSVSPNYSDPGAPPPVNPTPMMYMSKTSADSSSSQSQCQSQGDIVKSDNEVMGKNKQTLFSPLAFHPVIKKDIDTKYGKGGKFYFDKDVDGVEKSGFRATSVSGASPLSLSTFKKQRIQTDDLSGSEESDEDADLEEGSQYSDEHHDTFVKSNQGNIVGANTVLDFGAPSIGPEKSIFTPMLHSGGFSSPFVNNFGKMGAKPESPLPLNDIQSSIMTPAFYDASIGHHSPQMNHLENKKETDPPSKATETSNFLPLILRNVNVSTIPSLYLMNNLISDRVIPTFSMTEDEGDNDLETTNSDELIVKLRHLKELLHFISKSIVFDLGTTSKMYSQLKSEYNEDFSLTESNAIEYQTPKFSFLEQIGSVFPHSYQVCLLELVVDTKHEEGGEEEDLLDGDLNFLEQITHHESPKTRRRIKKELDSLTWNFLDGTTSQADFEKYSNLLQEFNSFPSSTDVSIFKTKEVKVKVNKNGSLIKLNCVGLDFWSYLDFSPVGGQRDFQMLAIGETSGFESSSYLHKLTDRLISNYKSCNFGSISKLNLSTVDTRPDLEPVSDGVMRVTESLSCNCGGYNQVNKKLNSLAELIKLDLINKTNNFEFDRPLLILFINFDQSFNSILQISKVLRNFKVALLNFQVPLVQIFAKIIPASMIANKVGSDITLKLFNNHMLSKISLSLYNECPQDAGAKLSSCQFYAPLVKEAPSRIPFKFINNSYRDISGSDDTFIHVAYERSIDRNWFAAAWTDPLGLVKHTKSWYCSPNGNEQNGAKPSMHSFRDERIDVATIADDIWNISAELFSALSRVNERENSAGGKKFLVLTRINSVIPDDELIHWKRLSMRFKDISLIVLSVNRTPKLTLSVKGENSNSTFNSPDRDRDSFFSFKNPNNINNTSPNTSSGGSVLATSPNGLAFHSPQQFLNMPSNFLSPQEIPTPGTAGSALESQNEPDAILKSADGDIYGVIPQVQLPSFNSPSRMNMKTGFLVKEQPVTSSDNEKGLLVFEVNLLSCSNYWNLDNLMKMMLSQYKNLTTLNDILGMRPIHGTEADTASLGYFQTTCVVPWHINAVGKLLNYVVHIYVEE